MRDAHSWDIGYDAGISGQSMPATPDGGDGDAIAHGYAAGEEAYLASIRREEQSERHPLHWQVAALAAGVWIVAGAIVALAWGVLR